MGAVVLIFATPRGDLAGRDGVMEFESGRVRAPICYRPLGLPKHKTT
jgi:hypothetical protein